MVRFLWEPRKLYPGLILLFSGLSLGDSDSPLLLLIFVWKLIGFIWEGGGGEEELLAFPVKGVAGGLWGGAEGGG